MLSERLQLTPATVGLCDAESRGRDAIARVLEAAVPDSWPPPVLEPDDVARIRRKLESDPHAGDWTLHYILRRAPHGLPDLVGVAGFAGPPENGAVEIGYAIATEHQRRGYATEAVADSRASALRDWQRRALPAGE